jgi:molybdopterin molybdotransferase
MDGFAVRFENTRNAPVKLKIIGEAVAGKGFDGKLKSGEAVRIMTGAPVPEGADAVQKVELTNETDGFIEILEKVKERQNVVSRGAEIKKAETVFRKGETITRQKIASLASFGCARVKVYKKPSVSILATGSEIVDVSQNPQKDQIRNSNSPMLKALAENYADVSILPLVKDDLETLKNQIGEIVNRLKSDVLIITGGVSVGDYDFTKPALRAAGAEIFFEKVSLKPGKPTVFARIGDTLVFGLPGNPVSVAVTFYLFARTAILLMQSAKDYELQKGFAVVAEKIKAAKERDSFLPVFVSTDEKGRLVIESLRFSGSSNFIEFARANALVFVPQNRNLEKGDVAEIRFLD